MQATAGGSQPSQSRCAASPDCIKDGRHCLIISPGHSLTQQCDACLGIPQLQNCSSKLVGFCAQLSTWV